MGDFIFAERIVEGRKMAEWLKSDEGLVDYSKCEFGCNVSNSEGIIIYDLGKYEYDDTVLKTRYHNGVDLARVAGSAMYNEAYYNMSPMTAINGDDYVRIFYNSFYDLTIQDFILNFFELLDGDIYVSDRNYHVFVKGRLAKTQEEWDKVVDALHKKSKRIES